MANHCWNWVCFTGDKDNLQKLHDGLRKAESLNAENDGLLWYETFYAALGLEVPTETKDVYNEFGSKWLDIHDIDLSDDSVELTGSSAWSPTSDFFLKLSKVYNLKFESEYDESGSDFGGFLSGSNGEIETNSEYTYIQYKWIRDGFEVIDIDYDNLETKEEAIEFYSPIKEVCRDGNWNEILKLINEHFK